MALVVPGLVSVQFVEALLALQLCCFYFFPSRPANWARPDTVSFCIPLFIQKRVQQVHFQRRSAGYISAHTWWGTTGSPDSAIFHLRKGPETLSARPGLTASQRRAESGALFAEKWRSCQRGADSAPPRDAWSGYMMELRRDSPLEDGC